MSQGMGAGALAHLMAKEAQVKQGAKGQTETALGSASWATPQEIAQAGIYDARPLVFGYQGNQCLFYNGDGHCLTFGPTGSGKSVSVVVPNLLTYPGSVVCIDPKGAIPAITAKQRRAMGQEVVLLDPFAEVENAMKASGMPRLWEQVVRATYNPLGSLNPHSPDVIEDVRLIAAGLVPEEEGKNRYFSDCARIIAECLLLDLISSAPESAWTLDSLFDLASRPRHVFENSLLPEMKRRAAFGGHPARLAQQISGYSSEGGAAIWTTLHRSLNLLQTPRLQQVCQSSAVNFRTLKERPATVYLVLPANRLHTHSVWLRLMLSIILNQLSDARQPRYPVLFLIDECAALGRLEILETAIGLMRGYGMKLWPIFQDLSQLQGIYKDRWSSFVSNSGIKQFFNVNDTLTADFVSDYLGEETRYVASESVTTGQQSGTNISALGRALLTPDEVRRLPKSDQILFYEGQKPILAHKLRYHENESLKALAAPDPYNLGKA